MRVLSSLAIFATATASTHAAPLFTEDFGSLATGTDIVTTPSANTNLDYARVGTGGGSIKALGASTIGSGSSGVISGPTTSSLNGIGKQAFTSSNVASLQMKLKLSNASGGDFFVGLGNGATFTGNGTFTTSHLMFGIQSDNGNLQYRTTGWNSFSPAATLSSNTSYVLTVIANRSGTSITNPNGGTIANATMDVYLNDTLIGNDVAITNNQDAAGFRFYSVSQAAATDTIEVDDILIDSAAILIPEPASLASLALGALALGRRRR